MHIQIECHVIKRDSGMRCNILPYVKLIYLAMYSKLSVNVALQIEVLYEETFTSITLFYVIRKDTNVLTSDITALTIHQ